MKTFYSSLLIILFLFTGFNKSQAQTQLNQVELMKQFMGTWKCELGKDTFLISKNAPFGTGMISNSEIVANGIALDSIIQLYGYDRKADKFIVAEQIKSSPVVEICSAWFTSETTGKIVVTNPKNAPFTFTFEFKSPERIVQNALMDGKVVKKVIGNRVK